MALPLLHRSTLRALLPVGAILIPALLLAVLGLRSYRAEALLLRERYREDQQRLVQLLGGRLAQAATAAMRDLAGRCRNTTVDSALEGRFVSAQRLARHVFMVEGGRLVYPVLPSMAKHDRGAPFVEDQPSLLSEVDVRNYIVRLRRLRKRRKLMRRALGAEHRSERKLAARLYRSLRDGGDGVGARALMGLARLGRVAGAISAAGDAYQALARRFAGRVHSGGADFALLADAGAAEIGGVKELLRLHRGLVDGRYGGTSESRHFYLRWVVYELRRRKAEASIVGRVERQTRWLFSAQRLGERLRRLDTAHWSRLPVRQVRSVVLDTRTTLVVWRTGTRVLGFLLDEDHLKKKVGHAQRELEGGGSRGLTLRLHRVGDVLLQPRGKAVYSATLDAPLNYWVLGAWTSGEEPLGQAERSRRLRSLTAIVGLLVLLTAGIFFTYRGVRREVELAALKSDFVSTVSHELKTPLTSIRMFAEMLEQGIAADDETRLRYQRVIIRESERLGQLIANVLDFSRIERGTRRYELGPERVSDFAAEAVETFQRLADGSGAEVVFRCSENLPPVRADREAAVTSMLNLLSNAAKYSRDNPRIEIGCSVAEGGGEVGVRVSDHGIGIPVSEHQRIFQDFYRAAGARAAGVEGTGLGLSLVRRHMEACGGRVEVESGSEGSTFILWFAIDQTASEETSD